jgi:hypothetical protein
VRLALGPPATLSPQVLKPAALVLSSIFAALSGYALLSLAADLYIAQAEQALGLMDERTRAPSEAEKARAERALNTALRVRPWDTDILGDLGDLYAWRAIDEAAHAANARVLRRESRDYYRRAAALRPTWPYTWANLAQTQLALTELDPAFAHALIRAAELGPAEPDVQIAVAELGISGWYALPEEAKQVVQKSARRGVQNSGSRLRSAALATLRRKQRELIQRLEARPDVVLWKRPSPTTRSGGADHL